MHIASMFRRARLSLLGTTFVSVATLSGCIITITDDVADDDLGDSSDTSDSDATSESSSSSSTSESTTDDPSESTTDDPSESTSEGDPTDTTTGGDACEPMAAMNGPEECWSPRGWFWNGDVCEQITCTCDGDDCDELFVDEQACYAQYGECLAEPPECAPQQVVGVGGCEPELGYFWNGVECELLSACSCEGPDCDSLFADEMACLAQYGECLAEPPPSCAPQEAAGVGGCELFLGWRWNGIDCEPMSGCSCEGADCDNLYAELDECKLVHEGCAGEDCAADDALPIGDCALPLGTVWTGDNCIGISGCECAGSDCAAVAMTSEQACWDAHALCELGDPCQADDAQGEGPCDLFFGWKWNGDACEGVSGCECIGLDCEFLELDLAVCEDTHAECGGGGAPPCPGITDAKGVGLCQLFLGWAWDGMQCVGVSGCSCEGADCNNLYPELDICQMETAGCQ